MIARRGLRQLAIGRRLDFETPVAWLQTGARVPMTDLRHRIDDTAAIDRGLDVQALAEAPIAFDDGVGGIYSVNDDGDAGTAGNHDHRPGFGRGGPNRRSDQNGQCHASAHRFGFRFCETGIVAERRGRSVKGRAQTSGKANGKAYRAG